MARSPLFDDEFADAPTKRVLGHILTHRKQKHSVVGVYCCYAPVELIFAMGGVPAALCAYSNKTIPKAEEDLPANLCPLIKSSYGFILSETCPFFELTDAVVAETTCDGKKKMYELIRERRPFHLMDLPQMPDNPEAVDYWIGEVRKLRMFLEETFATSITDEMIEEALCETNRSRALVQRIFDYAADEPPVLDWREMRDVTWLASISRSDDEARRQLEKALRRIEKRRSAGESTAKKGSPRVMVTGCPVGGDAERVYDIIEKVGGVIVALESCSGIKPFTDMIEEGTDDPLAAVARRYLRLPCSCMTPNAGRYRQVDDLVERFRPQAVIDVVLQACHTFNVESHSLARHVDEKHGLPFLKLELDYGEGDRGRLKTRIGALLEMVE